MKTIIILIGLLAILLSPYAHSGLPPAFLRTGGDQGLPPVVLYSIALCESGRKIASGFRPWPWTLNIDGKGHFFDQKNDAVLEATKAIGNGASVDVGIMQVNWKYHGHRFTDVSHALDPYVNLNTGALILKEYTKQRGSLWSGIGRFHSGTPERADQYQKRCLQHLVNTLEQAAIEQL